MLTQDQLLEILEKRYSTDNKGDYFHVTTGLTSGVVVDTDDPLQMGRLRIFCPSHGDDPKKIMQLPWAVYVSPFGGVINNSKFERSAGHTTEGAVAYGFWGIPELGANVLVGCIDGDLRRRFWIGTMYDQQETHTLGTGRYKWGSGGNVDGPFSSAGKPIEPAYSNAEAAFSGGKSSPEWQSREAEYTATAVDKSASQPPTPDKDSYLDQQYDDIADAQQFAFNKEAVGSNGYDWSGFGGLPLKSSRVVSLTSPGFAALTMDDRMFNNRTKLRSATGHTVLLDDTNERIYIRTNTGNAWVELDSSGNIDVYSARRISLNSDLDININSGKTVRIQGKEGVFMYAGDENDLPKLSEPPPKGQIRIQAKDDLHLVSNNLRQLSFENTIFEIGGNKCETVGDNSYTQVQHDINVITNAGDYNLTVTGNYNLIATGTINEFSILGSKYASKGNVEFYAYYGTVNIGAQTDVTVKSVSGSINIQAVGGNSANSGGVNIKSPNSQISVNKSGAAISTNGALGIQTGQGINMQAQSQSNQNQPIPEDQVPDVSCNIPTPVPIAGYTGVDLVARVAYNAGFRGRSLVVATAIAGAESHYNPNAIGDTGLETDKWGPSCGLWQIRSLKHPEQFNYPDSLRVQNDLFNPQTNANAAYAFSKQGQNFGAWTTYMNKSYLNFVNDAVTAINNMCSPVPSPTPMMLAKDNGINLDISGISGAPIEDLVFAADGLKPSVILTDTSVIIQTLTDVYVNSVGMSESIAILAGIKAKSDQTVAKCNEIIATLDGCCDSSIQPLTPISDAGVSAPVEQIPPNYFPYMNADSEQVFNLNNFDINGGTIIP